MKVGAFFLSFLSLSSPVKACEEEQSVLLSSPIRPLIEAGDTEIEEVRSFVVRESLAEEKGEGLTAKGKRKHPKSFIPSQKKLRGKKRAPSLSKLLSDKDSSFPPLLNNKDQEKEDLVETQALSLKKKRYEKEKFKRSLEALKTQVSLLFLHQGEYNIRGVEAFFDELSHTSFKVQVSNYRKIIANLSSLLEMTDKSKSTLKFKHLIAYFQLMQERASAHAQSYKARVLIKEFFKITE